MTGEKLLEILNVIADHAGWVIVGVFTLIGIIAVIRVIVKAVKGEAVEIHQVGIVNELPGSIVGYAGKEDHQLDDMESIDTYARVLRNKKKK